MPREMVPTVAGSPFVVKVGWSADSDVQLGVEGDEGCSMNWLLYGPSMKDIGERVWLVAREVGGELDERYEEIGRRVLDIFDSVPGSPYQGVWSNLDRAGCNRLIRLLRRARDAAFGADA